MPDPAVVVLWPRQRDPNIGSILSCDIHRPEEFGRQHLATSIESRKVFFQHYRKIDLWSIADAIHPEMSTINYIDSARDTLVLDTKVVALAESGGQWFDLSHIERLAIMRSEEQQQNLLVVNPQPEGVDLPTWVYAETICPKLKHFSLLTVSNNTPFYSWMEFDDLLHLDLVHIDDGLKNTELEHVWTSGCLSGEPSGWEEHAFKDTVFGNYADFAAHVHMHVQQMGLKDFPFWNKINFNVSLLCTKHKAELKQNIVPVRKQQFAISYWTRIDCLYHAGTLYRVVDHQLLFSIPTEIGRYNSQYEGIKRLFEGHN